MEFRILGTLEVVDGSRLVEVGPAAKKALLAILLLRPNQVVSVDRLVDDLWGDRAPPGAKGTLQSYISSLRRVLEPGAGGGEYRVLVTRHPGYLIQLEGPDQLDAARFEALVATGRQALARGDWAGAGAVLRDALALWRGPALADFAYQSFAQAEAGRLEQEKLSALEDRVDADLAVGRHGELVGELEALVGAHPLRERLWGQLMIALYRSGRQAEAVRAYQRLREKLGEELGMDPSPELQRLEGAILRQEDWLLPPRPAPGGDVVVLEERRAPGVAPHLPAPVSSFIGRAWERREVRKLVERERLVTLTGAGGCGKTRLALAAAADLVDAHPGGIWFADLGPVGDASLVPQALAGALGVREEPGRAVIDTVTDALRAQGVLVVLDNCEHVVEASARLADALLRSCPGLRILATSREILGIPGEAIFRVPSLSVPPAPVPLEGLLEYESVRLLVERATAVQPKLELSDDNAAAIVSICSRLDGIPLAIELAAARAAVLTPDQIAARLDDRFRLLVGGSRAALPRHQTLLATLEWSYHLLGAAEQALLSRLSVFACSFALEAAEAIASGPGVEDDDVFDLLAQLVTKSLLVMEPDAREARYRMLETIRAYAAEKLGDETDVVAERHLRYFTALAERAEPELEGPDQAAWLERLEAERDNLRAGLVWAIANRPGEAALALAGALWRYWYVRGHWSEGRELLAAALAGDAEAPPSGRAGALRGLGNLARPHGDYPQARSLHEEALAIYRKLGDRQGMANALNNLGVVAQEQGDYPEARSLFEEALAIYRELGDRRGMATPLDNLGLVAADQGDYPEARSLHEEALAIYRELGDRWGVAISLDNLGLVAREQGDYPGARSLFEEAVPIKRELGHRRGMAYSLDNLGLVAREQGDYPGARSLFEEALALRRQLGDKRGTANTLNNLGEVASDQGDYPEARSLFEEALALRRELGDKRGCAQCLEGLARLAAAQGHHRTGARLLGAAEALRNAIGAPLPPSEQARRDEALTAISVGLGEETLRSALVESAAMTLEDVLAYAAQDEASP